MKNLRTVFLVLLLFVSGCGVDSSYKSAGNYYFLNSDKDISSVGRVILVELANDSAYPYVSADITDALYESVQKKQIFGLTLIRQNDPAWRNLQLDAYASYTFEQLSAIQKTFRCNAVLRGVVTRYQPFPHMVIGLRLELIDLADGQLLWALEQIWDAADKNTQDRVKKYYNHRILPGSDSLEVGLGTVSSIKFIRFAAYETAETLQRGK
ncbi:MAG: hypothetical protein PHQ00_00780 [Phycisphaerae bacterium]|nr:hypothetical protein [Phycisphaerae bacterium]